MSEQALRRTFQSFRHDRRLKQRIESIFPLSFLPFARKSLRMALPNLRNIVSHLSRRARLPQLELIDFPQFASFRSPLEERDYSRAAFYKGVLWIVSCMVMSLIATNSKKGRFITNGIGGAAIGR